MLPSGSAHTQEILSPPATANVESCTLVLQDLSARKGKKPPTCHVCYGRWVDSLNLGQEESRLFGTLNNHVKIHLKHLNLLDLQCRRIYYLNYFDCTPLLMTHGFFWTPKTYSQFRKPIWSERSINSHTTSLQKTLISSNLTFTCSAEATLVPTEPVCP